MIGLTMYTGTSNHCPRSKMSDNHRYTIIDVGRMAGPGVSPNYGIMSSSSQPLQSVAVVEGPSCERFCM
jgi:hypothetical protein